MSLFQKGGISGIDPETRSALLFLSLFYFFLSPSSFAKSSTASLRRHHPLDVSQRREKSGGALAASAGRFSIMLHLDKLWFTFSARITATRGTWLVVPCVITCASPHCFCSPHPTGTRWVGVYACVWASVWKGPGRKKKKITPQTLWSVAWKYGRAIFLLSRHSTDQVHISLCHPPPPLMDPELWLHTVEAICHSNTEWDYCGPQRKKECRTETFFFFYFDKLYVTDFSQSFFLISHHKRKKYRKAVL